MNKTVAASLITGTFILGIPLEVSASTTARKQVKCSYTNATNATKNIAGVCKVEYGIVGMSGPAFRRVTWADGVVTEISINTDQASDPGVAVRVDGIPSQASRTCGYEVYRTRGNTLELKGDLCR